MHNRLNILLGLVFLIVPLSTFAQDSVLVIQNLFPSGRLNAVIIADTLVSPSWKLGRRVYALQKGGIFPQDKSIQIGNDRKLKLRAAYANEIEPVFGSEYNPMVFAYDQPGTTGRPPGTLFILGGTNNELNLKNISISGFDESNPYSGRRPSSRIRLD